MNTIAAGTKHEEKCLVTGENAINFMGLDGPRVLATPWMIAYMEMTCRNCALPHLPEGFDTVGTEVHVKHLAATPLGMTVTFRAEVISVEDRRVNFRVEASDEKEKVGEGTHQRFIVNVERFKQRLREKAGP